MLRKGTAMLRTPTRFTSQQPVPSWDPSRLSWIVAQDDVFTILYTPARGPGTSVPATSALPGNGRAREPESLGQPLGRTGVTHCGCGPGRQTCTQSGNPRGFGTVGEGDEAAGC